MKIRVEVVCIIYGKVSVETQELTERREILVGEINAPILPRAGEEIYLWGLGDLFPYDLKVDFVSWETAKKPGVLIPTIHLLDTDWNDKTSMRVPIELELKKFLAEVEKAGKGPFQFRAEE